VAPRLIIVDDSPQFRAAAAELLAGQGLEVLATAGDAAQAAAAAACACPDGILLDVNLTGRDDGFTLAGLLAGACPKVRIVLTSANIAAVPDDILKTCGAAAFVPKEDLAATDLGALFRPGAAQA
jgi:DNA-binding NarL/FixJ family response regulator